MPPIVQIQPEASGQAVPAGHPPWSPSRGWGLVRRPGGAHGYSWTRELLAGKLEEGQVGGMCAIQVWPVIFGRWSSLGELDFGGEGSQHFDLFPPALLTQAGADPNVE